MVKLTMFQAGKGDFFWLVYGEENNMHHILIDGGEKETAVQYRKTLQFIKKKNQSVDAVIFTHIDNDHIAGALHALVNMKEEEFPDIRSVYFNTGDAVCRRRGLAKVGRPEEQPLIKVGTGEHSVRKAVSLLAFLEAKGLKKFLKDYTIQGEYIQLPGGAELDVISPGEKELENLVLKWDKETVLARETGKQHRSAEAKKLPYQENIENYLNIVYPEDNSVTNRSSIAFIFRYDSVNIAFLGDACPSVCVEGIRKFFPQGIEADLIKLSHHGSGANISDELLTLLKSDRYLLSTTGEKLPKYLWARLVQNERRAYVYCNYDWWKGIYCQKYFSEKDYEIYITSGKLRAHLIGYEGEQVKDGLWIYRSMQI